MRERPLALDRFAKVQRFDGLWWRRFAYLGCVYGPDWWKRFSPPLIAAILFAAVGRTRRGAIANLQQVLDEPDRRRAALAALRMFADFAVCLTETLEHFGPRPHPIRLDGPRSDVLSEALRRGGGAVLVTGHFGNWDVAAEILQRYARPVNVVMAREANASAQEFVRLARERAGVRVLYSDSSVFSSLNMIHALRQNEIVALQLDRSSGAGGVRHLPFFGAPAPFPLGPFVLARLAGAPLIPVFVPRLGRRHYEIRCGEPIVLRREARDPHALDRAMRAVVEEFEAVVREFPSQWFQFEPFWPPPVQAPARAVRAAEPPARRRARG
jgi:KDO2-lipid IV(A) lauroyltransferase